MNLKVTLTHPLQVLEGSKVHLIGNSGISRCGASPHLNHLEVPVVFAPNQQEEQQNKEDHLKLHKFIPKGALKL